MDGLKKLVGLGAVGLFALTLAAAPASAQTSLDLLGDKDCFGTGAACVEDGVTWLPGAAPAVVQSGSDPSFTDIVTNTSSTVSWTHLFSPGTYSSAWLTIRTAGIADVTGPYQVFVDGVVVGSLPWDHASHFLVETFTFGLTAAMLLDGVATVSFTPQSADGWAIDYSEIITTPEPGTLAVFAMGLIGLAFTGRRRREDALSL